MSCPQIQIEKFIVLRLFWHPQPVNSLIITFAYLYQLLKKYMYFCTIIREILNFIVFIPSVAAILCTRRVRKRKRNLYTLKTPRSELTWKSVSWGHPSEWSHKDPKWGHIWPNSELLFFLTRKGVCPNWLFSMSVWPGGFESVLPGHSSLPF